LRSVVVAAVADGRFSVSFGKNTEWFPELLQPPALQHVIEASLKAIQTQQSIAERRRHSLVTLFCFFQARPGQYPELRLLVLAALPTLRLSPAEERDDVAPFLDQAAHIVGAKRLRVAIRVTPVERKLFAIDLGELLKGMGYLVVRNDPQVDFDLSIEELAYDARSVAPTTTTVTLDRTGVDIVYAVFWMPNYSSFLYDVSETNSEVSYAYEITVSRRRDGRSSDRLARAVERVSFRSCQNPRIINAFGGVIAARGWPSERVARECTPSNDIGSSLDRAKEHVIAKIALEAAALIGALSGD
jgi:hypothetical protein